LADGDKGLGSTFFFLFLTLFFLSIALLTRKKVVVLHTNYDSDSLEISFNKSNEVAVREFADFIINKTKEFLLNKYTKVDKDLPKENQLENLIFLRDKDLIDEAEFIRLKNVLFDKDSEKKIDLINAPQHRIYCIAGKVLFRWSALLGYYCVPGQVSAPNQATHHMRKRWVQAI